MPVLRWLWTRCIAPVLGGSMWFVCDSVVYAMIPAAFFELLNDLAYWWWGAADDYETFVSVQNALRSCMIFVVPLIALARFVVLVMRWRDPGFQEYYFTSQRLAHRLALAWNSPRASSKEQTPPRGPLSSRPRAQSLPTRLSAKKPKPTTHDNIHQLALGVLLSQGIGLRESGHRRLLDAAVAASDDYISRSMHAATTFEPQRHDTSARGPVYPTQCTLDMLIACGVLSLCFRIVQTIRLQATQKPEALPPSSARRTEALATKKQLQMDHRFGLPSIPSSRANPPRRRACSYPESARMHLVVCDIGGPCPVTATFDAVPTALSDVLRDRAIRTRDLTGITSGSSAITSTLPIKLDGQVTTPSAPMLTNGHAPMPSLPIKLNETHTAAPLASRHSLASVDFTTCLALSVSRALRAYAARDHDLRTAAVPFTEADAIWTVGQLLGSCDSHVAKAIFQLLTRLDLLKRRKVRKADSTVKLMLIIPEGSHETTHRQSSACMCPHFEQTILKRLPCAVRKQLRDSETGDGVLYGISLEHLGVDLRNAMMSEMAPHVGPGTPEFRGSDMISLVRRRVVSSPAAAQLLCGILFRSRLFKEPSFFCSHRHTFSPLQYYQFCDPPGKALRKQLSLFVHRFRHAAGSNVNVRLSWTADDQHCTVAVEEDEGPAALYDNGNVKSYALTCATCKNVVTDEFVPYRPALYVHELAGLRRDLRLPKECYGDLPHPPLNQLGMPSKDPEADQRRKTFAAGVNFLLLDPKRPRYLGAEFDDKKIWAVSDLREMFVGFSDIARLHDAFEGTMKDILQDHAATFQKCKKYSTSLWSPPQDVDIQPIQQKTTEQREEETSRRIVRAIKRDKLSR